MASSSPSLLDEVVDASPTAPLEEEGPSITGTPKKKKPPAPANIIKCTECEQTFSKPGNRNKHLRNMHGIQPELTPVETREKGCRDCGILFPTSNAYHRHRKEDHGSLHCPMPDCSWRGSSHKGLGKHAADSHAVNGKTFEWRSNHFPDAEQFNRFIRDMYEKGHLWYIRNGSNSTIEERIEYRYCHREDRRGGGERKKPMRLNRKKRKGKAATPKPRVLTLERSEACCTSYMRVRWRKDGRVEADYCIDHLGHDTEAASLPLLPEHKKEILELLQIEDDPEEVVKRLRKKYKAGRLATVEEEDIRDVMMEEVDPFGEMTYAKEEEEEAEGTLGATACITMEFSPSPSHDDTNSSSALLAMLDEHNVRDRKTITLGELVAANAEIQQPPGSRTKVKRPRFKLTDNEYVFRFDKNSVCGQRQFWRCEKKNDCAARIHTDMKGTIVKRINYHTHPAQQDPEQVCIPKKKPRMTDSPSYPSTSVHITEGAGILRLPTFDESVNDDQELSHFDTEGGVNGLLHDTFIKEEDMDIINGPMVFNGGENGEDAGAMPAELPRPPEHISSMQGGSGQEVPSMSEDFWRVFNLTKKVYAVVKKEMERNDHLNDNGEMVDDEVATFLYDHRFSQFASKLRRFTKMELRQLSVAECKDVLDDVAEGVRLHHAMRSEWGERNFPSIRVYVASADEMNPVYKMVTLPEGRRCLHSVRDGLERRGVLTEEFLSETIICVKEGTLTVELCDEMIEEWTDHRAFTYRRSGDYLVLESSQI